jgi:hypothetical protein
MQPISRVIIEQHDLVHLVGVGSLDDSPTPPYRCRVRPQVAQLAGGGAGARVDLVAMFDSRSFRAHQWGKMERGKRLKPALGLPEAVLSQIRTHLAFTCDQS